MICRMTNTNFFEHATMTKRSLPLWINRGECHVVTAVSTTGFFFFTNTSTYSATKHAMKSFSGCLRREKLPWNLRVSIIEPGVLIAPMLNAYEKTWRTLWREPSTKVRERCSIDYLNQIITQSINSPFMSHVVNPQIVVEAIPHALASKIIFLRLTSPSCFAR